MAFIVEISLISFIAAEAVLWIIFEKVEDAGCKPIAFPDDLDAGLLGKIVVHLRKDERLIILILAFLALPGLLLILFIGVIMRRML